jgi:hypothetical protein
MQVGVFLPIGNNGWLISTASPHFKPSFDLNRAVMERAERYGMEFALSMIKLRGFGGPRRRHQPHPVVRNRLGADAAPADRRAHGGDDRQHLARPVRPQHDHRLAGERVFLQ